MLGFARFFLRGLLRAVRVYLPVFVLPLVLLNGSRLRAAPLESLAHAAAGTARSSVFLSTYCTGCWVAVYLLERYAGVSTHWNGVLSGMAGGLAVALEKRSRRIELALYVLTQALQTGWNIQVSGRRRQWRRPGRMVGAGCFRRTRAACAPPSPSPPHMLTCAAHHTSVRSASA